MSNGVMEYWHLQFKLKLLISEMFILLAEVVGQYTLSRRRGKKEGEEQNKYITAGDAPFTI